MSGSVSIRIDETILDLGLGPLHYRFEAQDRWGDEQLNAIADNLCGAVPPSVPDRIVRICREQPDSGAGPWLWHSSTLGTIAHRTDKPTANWTAAADACLPQFRYQLPWALILTDMVKRGGAIIHAGLAAHHGRGLLFLAPPGGGKSTTLATAPLDWTVLSDDAALLWPEQQRWQASPLPSWTMMTASSALPSEQPFDLSRFCMVAGLIVLEKGKILSCERLSPVSAAPHLFRALEEYPSTVMSGLHFKEHFFRTACALVRALPCWRLELPLGADVWPLLAELTGEEP